MNDKRNKDVVEIWDMILEQISPKVNEIGYFTWIKPIKPIRFDDNSIVLEVPNNFFMEWIKSHYESLIIQILKSIISPDSSIIYEIDTLKNETDILFSQLKDLEDSQHFNQNLQVGPSYNDNLNERYSLKNFIMDENNQLAVSTAFNTALNPCATPFNPLIYYGDHGVGKTHLIQAIGNEVKTKSKNKRVFYISGRKFIQRLIKIKSDNNLDEDLYFYKLINVYMLDDIQFILNDEHAEEILISILDILIRNKAQIVLSCEKSPEEYEEIREKLLNFLKKGVSVRIGNPSFETRIAILKQYLEFNKFVLSDDILEYIAQNITTNIKDLKVILSRILKNWNSQYGGMDFDLAEEIIRKIREKNKKNENRKYN